MFLSRQRNEDRSQLKVEAIVRFGGREASAILVNASSRGISARFSAPPPRGTPIAIEIAGEVLKGHVRWRGLERCGIALRERINLSELLAGRVVTLVPDHGHSAYRELADAVQALLPGQTALGRKVASLLSSNPPR